MYIIFPVINRTNTIVASSLLEFRMTRTMQNPTFEIRNLVCGLCFFFYISQLNFTTKDLDRIDRIYNTRDGVV